MRKLRHPHIGEYIGAALCHSERYILLELCQGGSVRQLLDREHSDGLPHATLHLYGTQLLSGVTFLHERGCPCHAAPHGPQALRQAKRQ